MVVGEEQTRGERGMRRVYHVTPAGDAAFLDWMRSPMDYLRVRDPAHLRAAYLESAAAGGRAPVPAGAHPAVARRARAVGGRDRADRHRPQPHARPAARRHPRRGSRGDDRLQAVRLRGPRRTREDRARLGATGARAGGPAGLGGAVGGPRARAPRPQVIRARGDGRRPVGRPRLSHVPAVGIRPRCRPTRPAGPYARDAALHPAPPAPPLQPVADLHHRDIGPAGGDGRRRASDAAATTRRHRRCDDRGLRDRMDAGAGDHGTDDRRLGDGRSDHADPSDSCCSQHLRLQSSRARHRPRARR